MSKIAQISNISNTKSKPKNQISINRDMKKLMRKIELDGIGAPKRALKEFSSNSTGTIGYRYQFRAECHRDAELFLRAIIHFIEPSWTISPISYYPDVEVKFSIMKEISPRALLWIACSIVDGHVLVETLEKEDKYTGERVYQRDLDVNAAEYKPSAAVLKDMKKGAAHHIASLKHLLSDAKVFAENLKELSA